MKPVSKDSIRSRLLKNAAHFWGEEATQHLDPFAQLLMEALATELYKAYNEMQTTEARILEKITRLLTPELYVSPRPAHAVAHLRIRETGQVLDSRNQFFTQQRIATKEEGILDAEYPVVFTPLGAVPLLDGDVRFIAAGDRMFSVADTRAKTFFAASQSGLPQQQLWIGLELNPAETPRDLTLYLRFSLEVEDFVYSLLPTAQWSVGGVPVTARSGMQLATTRPRSSEEAVFADFETMNLIERDIQTHYARYFVTLEGVADALAAGAESAVPADLAAAFPEAASLASNKQIRWIGATVPSYFTPELLDHLSVSVNAFPVVNRRLHVQYHPLREVTKIIPLTPQPYEQFLSIASLTDDRGGPYHALPFRTGGEDAAGGFYSIKYGGAERFDERDAQEYLSNLTELLRDEVAAFAAYGKDFMRSTVTELSKKIRLIQQRARTDLSRFLDVPTYLMLEPTDAASGNVEVQYWITNTALANGIRAGTELLRLQTSLNILKSPVLLTPVSGGRGALGASDRLAAYKYTLTTRDRLVTAEDIRSYCSLVLGDRLRTVAVRKGVSVGTGEGQGLISTTDVVLTPADTRTPAAEWGRLCADLREQIAARSMHGIHFRVMVA